MLGWWLLSCGKDDGRPSGDADADVDADADADADADTDADPPRTYVRMAHVGPALGPVDLWVDGAVRPIASGFAPPDGTRFTEQPPGQRRFAVTAPGGNPNQPLASVQAPLDDGQRSTLVLYGTPGDVGFQLFPEVVNDFPSDQVRYTFFGAIPGLEVDVLLGAEATRAPYGTRVILGETAPVARDVSVDVDRDGVADCTVTVQGVGAGTIAALYLVGVGGVPTVYGHDPEGRFLALAGGACGSPGGSGASHTGAASDTGTVRHTGGP